MGLFGGFFKGDTSNASSKQRQRSVDESQKCYTPEEYVIYEQEQSSDMWHGVPLSKLSRLAAATSRGKYVEVDKYGFLVFYYSSRSGKTSESVQCEIGENVLLKALPHGYYPGQWTDSSDEFIEGANQQFIFSE